MPIAFPGRVRIPFGAFSGNRAKALNAAALARAIPGVESAEVSRETGSLLVYHNPRSVAAETLLGMLRARGYVRSHDRLAGRRRSGAAGSVVLWLLRAVFQTVAAV